MQRMNWIDHIEGGRYCEVYRSPASVQTQDKGTRTPLTHIYFSLDPGEVSHFHRVSSDEVWNLYQGAGVALYLWDGVARSVQRVDLSAASQSFCHVVTAHTWQAAIPLENTVLLGCSVAPGFEFADFELLDRHSRAGMQLIQYNAEIERLVLAYPQDRVNPSPALPHPAGSSAGNF